MASDAEVIRVSTHLILYFNFILQNILVALSYHFCYIHISSAINNLLEKVAILYLQTVDINILNQKPRCNNYLNPNFTPEQHSADIICTVKFRH